MKNTTRGGGLLVVLAALAAGGAMAGADGAAAQDASELGVSGHNQTEYSRSKDGDLEILLEWLDIDATYGDFRGGFRYEAFQPPRPGDPLGDAVRSGFPFRYVETSQSFGSIRVGNFYNLFGRGLTLNLFENRDVRIDANLDGVRYAGEWRGFALTALSGRARVTPSTRWTTGASPDQRLDVVHAADLTWQPVTALRLGGTLVADRAPGATVHDDVLRDMHAGRAEIWTGPLAFYYEEARLANREPGIRPEGRGRYGSLTLSGPGFGLLTEVRDYNAFSFHTSGGDIYLNNPPAGTREHAYTLLNRHPHTLDVMDERGYQVEATLAGAAGFAATLNHSYVERHSGQRTYRESYVELHHDEGFGRVSGLIGVFDYLQDLGTRDLTLIGEGTLGLTEAVSARLEFGNQHVKSDVAGEYDDHLAVLEVARAPGITTGVTVEWNNKSDLQRELAGEDETAWAQVSLGLQLVEGTDVTVSYGSRQAGYYCVGGRCRYEPAFEGVELKFLAQF